MPQKSHRYNLTLEIKREDLCDVWAYKNYISDKIKKGEEIPIKILDKFFTFFTFPIEQQKVIFKEKLKNVKSELLNHFSKEFGFKKKLNSIEYDSFTESFYKIEYTFSNLINYIFQKISFDIYVLNNKKNSFIKHLHEIIESYFNRSRNTKRFFRKYKRDVIIAYITFSLGFKISTDAELDRRANVIPTNSDLSGAIKNITNTLLKNKKKSK